MFCIVCLYTAYCERRPSLSLALSLPFSSFLPLHPPLSLSPRNHVPSPSINLLLVAASVVSHCVSLYCERRPSLSLSRAHPLTFSPFSLSVAVISLSRTASLALLFVRGVFLYIALALLKAKRRLSLARPLSFSLFIFLPCLFFLSPSLAAPCHPVALRSAFHLCP